MKIPDDIRKQIREHVWAVAEQVGWSDLQDSERAKYYENWTRDAAIGVRLGHFMDPRKVRVYIKDSLLKPYERVRMSGNGQAVFQHLALASIPIVETYVKPHGRRLEDGRIICWGKSRDWKLVLMASFERSRKVRGGMPHAVVLIESGNTVDASVRDLIREAATRLGIERVEWLGQQRSA
jgi:hypothetical protein